jgi:hypothetical protein
MAVLDSATNKVINGAVSPNSNEVLTALINKAQRVTIQTCRQRGTGEATVRVAG